VIGNQTTPVATQVQQWIPIRAVARQACDLVGKDDAHLAQRDGGDQVLKPLAVLGSGCGQAQIGVDQLNVFIPPAELLGPLPQGVLQAQAFLIGQHLVRAGLADVDHGTAAQMLWGDQFAAGHKVPPEEWRLSLRRFGAGVRG
jgi:hypothetical protein